MIVRFGSCVVDLDRVELHRDGDRVQVQPQVFAILEHLITHRDRVVSKEELLDQVWGDRFVGESALASRIKFVRRAVGDSGTSQAVIRTVQGRGYRFVAEVLDESPGVDRTVGASPMLPTSDDWPFVGRIEEVDRVLRFAETPDCAGVVVTADADGGLTSFAARCAQRLADDGYNVTTIVGLQSTADIPLAALNPLVPGDLLQSLHDAGDLTEGVVFHRARAAVEAALAGPERVLIVDDAHLLDALSRALITSLATTQSLFLLVTQHPSAVGELAFEQLIRDGTFRSFSLLPLDETEIDVVLFRVLQGPVEMASMQRLGEASAGRPGLLRDIVETSRDSGVLHLSDGNWRLDGPLESSRVTWPIDDLPTRAVDAVEALAVIGAIGIDELTALYGDDAVDALDQRHLLNVDRIDSDELVRLSDPLLTEAVARSISTIRLRRLQGELFDAVVSGRKRPANLATLVSWAISDERGSVHPLDALDAARRALMAGDDVSADVLVEHVGLADESLIPFVLAIQAEVLFRRGNFEQAGELLERIDRSALDDVTRAFVTRRAITVRCYVHAEYAESVEQLERDAAQASAALARSMDVHRVYLLTMLGRVDEAEALGAPLIGQVHPQLDVEATLALARVSVLQGDLDRASQRIEHFDERLRDVFTGVAGAEPREAAVATRLACLLNSGDIAAASELIRAGDLVGKRASRSWLPLAAAEVEIEAGRYQLARSMLRRVVTSNRHQGLRHGRIASEVMFLRTTAVIGNAGDAHAELDAVLAELPDIGAANSWYVAESAARAAGILGRGAECAAVLRPLAAEAAEMGAHLSELALLCTWALTADDGDQTAEVAPRVRHLADLVGGPYWAARADLVTAYLGGLDTVDAARQLRMLGYVALAEEALLPGLTS